MQCKNCGADNGDDAKFCRKCGSSLTIKQPRKKTRISLITAACIGILAAVAITVATLWFRHYEATIIPTDSEMQNNTGAILVIDKKTEKLRNENEGRKIIIAHQDELGVTAVEEMLGTCNVDRLAGSTYYRYDLEFEGVPIYGRSIVLVADQDSMLSAISSSTLDMSGCKTKPAIDEDEAHEALGKGASATTLYTSELVYYAAGNDSPTLAYCFSFIDEDGAGSFFVSASDGSILGQTKDVQALRGQGKDIHGSDRRFEVASRLEVIEHGDEVPGTSQGFYVLADMSRNIYIYDAGGDGPQKAIASMEVSTSNGTKYHLLPANTEPGYSWQDSQGNEASVIGKNGDSTSWRVRRDDGSEESVVAARFNYENHLVTTSSMAVDAPSAVTLMSCLEDIYDFYSSDATFARKGFDGANGRVNAVCNVACDNAFAWAPTGSYAQIICGKDPKHLAPVVIAHEFAHTVQGSICSLSGTGESGSIMEGTSDVLGILACDYADNGKMDNSANWAIPSRNLVDPEKTGNPMRYKQDGFWADTTPRYDNKKRDTNDYGGVHQNSTVLSHAAYLMCDKSSDIGGSVLTTNDVGILVMSAFHMVSDADCDFAEFAGYMNCIAREKLGKNKSLRVEKAFETVGIEPWIVVFLDGRTESTNEDEQKANEGVPRKLITSFHITHDSKQSENDSSYEEWVKATYDDQGCITHKEITRKTSFKYWEGEPAYSLDFSYDTNGRLTKISGTEGDPGWANPGTIDWDIAYEGDGPTSHATGAEYSDRRYIDDVYDADGNLVTRDYLIRTAQVVENGTLTLSYDKDGRIVGQSAKKGYNIDQSYVSDYKTSVGYDQASRITSIETLDTNEDLFISRTYNYDDAGRITQRNRVYGGGDSNITVNQSYVYDKNGHLSSVDQTSEDTWWVPAKATFTTDEDGSILSARIEEDNNINTDQDTITYEVEYVTISTPLGQEPFNAVDLTDPLNPELYNELWVSHSNLDPTPYDESAYLRENRRWLELHEVSSIEETNAEKQKNNYEHFACSFIKEIYDDWKFDNGQVIRNKNEYPSRCLRYVDSDSTLYSDFLDAEANTTAEYWKNVATCVVGEPIAKMISERVCRVTISYIFTQNSVDQATYDRMLQDTSSSTWDVTMDEACKIIDLQSVPQPESEESSSSDQTNASDDSERPDLEADPRQRRMHTV